MHLITRNVNTAFRSFVELLDKGRIESNPDRFSRVLAEHIEVPIARRPSRNGPVLMIDEPVTITYTHPRERVLFNQVRDANPFLHLYHALWMLAGRNDVAPLAYYAKNMANYSDDGKTLNGAYGYRWRRADKPSRSVDFDGHRTAAGHYDQLDILVNHLKADPTSRRAVLQMWNVEDDLLKVGPGEGTSKDVCCNTAVYFSIRQEDRTTIPVGDPTLDGKEYYASVLDVTVTNRSNDLIWGCLGEDYVTFSVLQEYVAARIGVEVGRCNQFTNNLHAYESNWKPEEWLAEYQVVKGNHEYDGYGGEGGIQLRGSVPLIENPAVFDRELTDFVQLNGDGTKTIVRPRDWREPFLATVAQPMMNVIHARKRRESPERWLDEIAATDWRTACRKWVSRRNKR